MDTFRDHINLIFTNPFYFLKKNTREETFWALKQISLNIYKGDKIILFGKNGAGKSTLLKILSKVELPTEGVMEINGKVTSLLQAGVGFHGELTGRENIFLSGSILGIPQDYLKSICSEIIKFAEIEDFIDTPIKAYSSGMVARLGFSIAVHNQFTDTLILDEILSVGDVSFKEKSMKKMREILENRDVTLIYVGHAPPPDVDKIFNRGLVISKGSIIYDGTVDDSYEIYKNENTETTHI